LGGCFLLSLFANFLWLRCVQNT